MHLGRRACFQSGGQADRTRPGLRVARSSALPQRRAIHLGEASRDTDIVLGDSPADAVETKAPAWRGDRWEGSECRPCKTLQDDIPIVLIQSVAEPWGAVIERVPMQSAALMSVYLLTTIAVQAIGVIASKLVETQWPSAGLPTFLLIFVAAFGVAWPLAVRITEWGIRAAGYRVDGLDA